MKEFYKYFTIEELTDIYEEQDMVLKAKKLVDILFKDKVDKAGEPYVWHLYHVQERLKNETEEMQTAGLLHDTLEDINGVTESILLDIGFTPRVVYFVKNLTNNGTMSYDAWISSICETCDLELIKIKYADIVDNYKEERLAKLSKEEQIRLNKKYSGARIRLYEAVRILDEDFDGFVFR